MKPIKPSKAKKNKNSLSQSETAGISANPSLKSLVEGRGEARRPSSGRQANLLATGQAVGASQNEILFAQPARD